MKVFILICFDDKTNKPLFLQVYKTRVAAKKALSQYNSWCNIIEKTVLN